MLFIYYPTTATLFLRFYLPSSLFIYSLSEFSIFLSVSSLILTCFSYLTPSPSIQVMPYVASWSSAVTMWCVLTMWATGALSSACLYPIFRYDYSLWGTSEHCLSIPLSVLVVYEVNWCLRYVGCCGVACDRYNICYSWRKNDDSQYYQDLWSDTHTHCHISYRYWIVLS